MPSKTERTEKVLIHTEKQLRLNCCGLDIITLKEPESLLFRRSLFVEHYQAFSPSEYLFGRQMQAELCEFEASRATKLSTLVIAKS